MDCMQESIIDLKKQLHEEVHFRKLLIKLFTSMNCENAENHMILSQQLQIYELKQQVHKLSSCLSTSNEYINDLYWALFHDKPVKISPIIAPPEPPESLCPIPPSSCSSSSPSPPLPHFGCTSPPSEYHCHCHDHDHHLCN